MIFRVVVAGRGFLGLFAFLALRSELFSTQFRAAGTNDGAVVQPVVLQNSDVEFLAGMEALVGVVGNVDLQSAVAACVFVAARPIMLPLPCLVTISLFPHLFAVLEALRLVAVLLQRKVLLAVWVVFGELALRAPDDNVLASPSEFLDVRAVVSERDTASVKFQVFMDVIKG